MKKKLFGNDRLSSLCLELGLILQAGISVYEGIMLISEDEEDERAKAVFAEVFENLEMGEEFSEALAKTGAFPKYMTDMVRIGENTGSLEEVFKGLALYYERQENISKSIRNAVVYPAVLFVIMVVVIGVLVVKVLPIFNEVFNQLGAVMSPVATGFLNFGLAVSEGKFIILGIIIAIVIIILVIRNNENARAGFMRWWSGRFSGTKTARKIAAARFASAMAMGISAGLDTDESLEMAQQLDSNSAISKNIEECRAKTAEGESFYEAVNEAGIFEPLYCRMLAVGVKTGAADSVMEEIARRTAEEADESIERIINRVEPVLVIIMSVLVGLVLLSVMLPLMGIMSSIG
ncbi:MAG: type II secretion system F family protein [Firmicutes bacterium]|nr:type II secretion system F family protein [Bacillota bacterium]